MARRREFTTGETSASAARFLNRAWYQRRRTPRQHRARPRGGLKARAIAEIDGRNLTGRGRRYTVHMCSLWHSILQLVSFCSGMVIVAVATGARSSKVPGKFLRAAVWYATRLKWPVFPIVPGSKEPLTRRGFKDATLDEKIRIPLVKSASIPAGSALAVVDLERVSRDQSPGTGLPVWLSAPDQQYAR